PPHPPAPAVEGTAHADTSMPLLPQPGAASRSRSRPASRLERAPLGGGPDERGTPLSPDTGRLQSMLAAAIDRDRPPGNPVAARFPPFLLRIPRLAAACRRHRPAPDAGAEPRQRQPGGRGREQRRLPPAHL